MKYYIIAGEASGDLHGSNLIQFLLQEDPSADIRAWGGDRMKEAGATLVKHFKDLAFMGFAEVVSNLPTIVRNLRFCKKDILDFQPNIVVLIDYPGFNLRIAAWAKRAGFKVAYYIAPQVWAWKESRVKQMKQHIDKMIVILPFEKAYFENKWNWPVTYVGHPLMPILQQKKDNCLPDHESKVIAILPGSRKQEIKAMLPVMLDVSKNFPEFKFVVAKAPGQEDAFYEELIKDYPGVFTVKNDTYKLLLQSRAALVASGTATLETALLKVPEIVCYKGNPISFAIGKKLIKVKYISLVNLIVDRPLVKELIQGFCNPASISEELRSLLENPIRQLEIKEGYTELEKLLSTGENPSRLAASIIAETAQESI